MGSRAWFLIAMAGCGSVHDTPPDGLPGIDTNFGGEIGACGARGEVCCAAAMCDPRASCDGTACIAADVWSSAADGTFDFNGGSWTHPLVMGSTAQLPAVNGLWGTTSTFVVGVGASGLILRFDGTDWRKDVPATTGVGELFAVAGSASNNVWAVGDGHFSHFSGSGSGWLDQTAPPTNGEAFLAVWLDGTGNGWATGVAGNLARLTNGVWTKISREGNGYDKYGLWGSAPNDVWMVGEKKSLATGLPLAIEHFDGNAWSDGAGALDPNGTLPPLHAVWGTDANHVWAVGDKGTIVFWNGVLWTSLLSGTTDNLVSIWGSNPNDLWVAGAGGMRHFDGVAWGPIAGLTSPPIAVWLSPE